MKCENLAPAIYYRWFLSGHTIYASNPDNLNIAVLLNVPTDIGKRVVNLHNANLTTSPAEINAAITKVL